MPGNFYHYLSHGLLAGRQICNFDYICLIFRLFLSLFILTLHVWGQWTLSHLDYSFISSWLFSSLFSISRGFFTLPHPFLPLPTTSFIFLVFWVLFYTLLSLALVYIVKYKTVGYTYCRQVPSCTSLEVCTHFPCRESSISTWDAAQSLKIMASEGKWIQAHKVIWFKTESMRLKWRHCHNELCGMELDKPL